MSTRFDRINDADKPALPMDPASRFSRLSKKDQKALRTAVEVGFGAIQPSSKIIEAGFFDEHTWEVTEDGYTALGQTKPDKRSVSEKIRDGFYQSKVPYPSREQFPNRSKDPAYLAARKAHYDDQGRLDEQFKLDLFKEEGVEDNPKRDKCYALAYEHGHSSGKSDVANYFSEFAELIK